MRSPLRDILRTAPVEGYPRQLVLLTDGQVAISLCHTNKTTFDVTCAIGWRIDV
jgi:hypothetical protein